MADNVTLASWTNTAAGPAVATEGTTINAVAVQVQQVKPVLGARDSYTGSQGGRLVDGTADTAAAYVDTRSLAKLLTANPTISTTAYANGYAIGAQESFANAARASGGSIVIQGVAVTDKSKQNSPMDLVFFNQSFTAPTDHAAFNPSAADLANIIAIIPVFASDYSTFSANSAAAKTGLAVEILLSGTSTLYMQAVCRGTPTYTGTTDLTFNLTILQD